uniref:Uncharacterized protein n=1 Tax=Arundo donax TaxID=35708 RepID=A0A0A8YQQ5_ARUDO
MSRRRGHCTCLMPSLPRRCRRWGGTMRCRCTSGRTCLVFLGRKDRITGGLSLDQPGRDHRSMWIQIRCQRGMLSSRGPRSG